MRRAGGPRRQQRVGAGGSGTRIVRGLAPGVPIENVQTIAQIKDQSVSPRRLNAVLVWSFGLLALIIAAVGIAGVLAFSVSARTNEIGIRMSLGADPGRVQRMILGEGGVCWHSDWYWACSAPCSPPAPSRACCSAWPLRPGHVRAVADRDGSHRHRGQLDSGAPSITGGPGDHDAGAVGAGAIAHFVCSRSVARSSIA